MKNRRTKLLSGSTSAWCSNSRRWLIPCGWNIKSCPYKEIMRNGCVGCAYYEERPLTKYAERELWLDGLD